MPYLLVFAGDADGADSDFLAVIDLRPESPDFGKAIATMSTGMKSSMPHHMEYAMPPADELLFMNAHHHEMSMLVDVSNPRAPRVAKTFMPPAPLRYPHDYSRTPKGTRLVGFLRSPRRVVLAAISLGHEARRTLNECLQRYVRCRELANELKEPTRQLSRAIMSPRRAAHVGR